MLLMAANFGKRDLYLTITYDAEHEPDKRADAQKCFRAYMRLLRTEWRKAGHELKYIYNIEGKHGDKRLHHHLVINNAGVSYETIRSLWAYGKDIEIRFLDISRYAELSKYLTKEAIENRNPNSKRNWITSRNLQKPVKSSELVDDSTVLLAPAGTPKQGYIADNKQTQFGEYQYLQYFDPKKEC